MTSLIASFESDRPVAITPLTHLVAEKVRVALLLNPATTSEQALNGGDATNGDGGNGGSLNLSGVAGNVTVNAGLSGNNNLAATAGAITLSVGAQSGSLSAIGYGLAGNGGTIVINQPATYGSTDVRGDVEAGAANGSVVLQ